MAVKIIRNKDKQVTENILKNIKSPDDVKKLSVKELGQLASEIRETIIGTVSNNGGHLASNLGIVEATVALHKIFSSPSDKIIFDVGHQSYAHKLLTGRYELFGTLRQYGGISGFSDRFESEHDVLNEGHCGTSLSAALGIAVSNKIQGKDDFAVAVVGDGALSNGMIYEALNNCADKKINLVIVINDNDMAISKSVGGLHNYLSKIRISKRYFRFKRGLDKTLSHIPLIGKSLASLCRKFKNAMKRLFVKNTFFEDLGLNYIGPVNGYDLKQLTAVFEEAKKRHTCCVVHIATRKGKGYEPAEKNPDLYHMVGAFDAERGVLPVQNTTFSVKAGEIICDRAEKDSRICAITAAMCEGTGLRTFSERFPDRFFDVGIAEEHAVTFAAGLSVNGMKPVLFLYSTFAQRSFDQLLHDISIQRLPMVLMLDRSGIVPGDGITHQGIFDYPLFSSIPNVKIYSPETYSELSECFDISLKDDTLSVIRYPKGDGLEDDSVRTFVEEDGLKYSKNIVDADVVIVTYGRLTQIAYEVAEMTGTIKTGILKLLRIFPLSYDRIVQLTSSAKLIYFLEEGYESGGVSEKIASHLRYGIKTEIHAIKTFVGHGSLDDLYEFCGFTPAKVAENIKKIFID